MIFSEEISHKFSLNYYDPETPYEEDVMNLIKEISMSREIYSAIDV